MKKATATILYIDAILGITAIIFGLSLFGKLGDGWLEYISITGSVSGLTVLIMSLVFIKDNVKKTKWTTIVGATLLLIGIDVGIISLFEVTKLITIIISLIFVIVMAIVIVFNVAYKNEQKPNNKK